MFKPLPLDTELPNLALYLTNVGREFLRGQSAPNHGGGRSRHYARRARDKRTESGEDAANLTTGNAVLWSAHRLELLLPSQTKHFAWKCYATTTCNWQTATKNTQRAQTAAKAAIDYLRIWTQKSYNRSYPATAKIPCRDPHQYQHRKFCR